MVGVKFLYLVATSFCWSILQGAKTCDEPILEKLKINQKDYLIQNSGAPKENLTLGIPLVGGTDAWELRYGGNQTSFVSPLFALGDKPGEQYWLTAVAIQNGYGAGSMCGSKMMNQSNFIKKIKLTVGTDLNTSEFVSIHAPYAAEMDNRGKPIINLQQLGFKGRGRLIRINFPPIAADVVKLDVVEFLQPADPIETQSVCLRVELYGCKIGPGPGPGDQPDINMDPLLQYIMPYPDALANGYRHLDTGYTGVESLGLLSGGAGILTDGSLGETPSENPDLYLGWSSCSTNNPHIIFLFNNVNPISDFIVRLWDNDNSRLVEYSDFTVYDQNENEIQFDGLTVFNVSFLKIAFSYPTGSKVLLLSEVSFTNASSFDVLTGSNLTELLLAKYQNIANYTSTTTLMSSVSNTTTLISSVSNTTTLISSVSNTTTLISSVSNTTTLMPSYSSSTDSEVMSSSNITFPTTGSGPTVTPAESVRLEQTTVLYIVIGALCLLVILLILIVVMQGIMLICYYRSTQERLESQFYPERLDDNSGGNTSNTNPMEYIRSNEARVTEKPTDLSESQVYL